ncbi:MAG: carbohydrate ABC transporter permease [Anaerolineae bacterium]|nr:carbohydrate ABC transporter permease [Anaerolineae bacterium]
MRLSKAQSDDAPINTRLGDVLQKTLTTGLLIFCTALFFTPFLWLISASLKVRSDVFSSDWIPDPIAWENYANVWQVAPLLTWLKNSLVVGTLAALTVTVSCSLIAFGFSYFRFRGRDTLFGFVLGSMMLPGVVTMIPVFLIWNSLGLANSQVPLWAGNLFGSAFYIFLIRQFYLSLPRDLFEAARVDGATYFQMWRYVALPLTRTALIVVFIFEFKASWTNLVGPLIYLHNSTLYTLPLGLKTILDQFGQGGEMQWEIVLAASVIVTLPMIFIFFLGQRYFMDGIATSGLKG